MNRTLATVLAGCVLAGCVAAPWASNPSVISTDGDKAVTVQATFNYAWAKNADPKALAADIQEEAQRWCSRFNKTATLFSSRHSQATPGDWILGLPGAIGFVTILASCVGEDEVVVVESSKGVENLDTTVERALQGTTL